jgi:hypothetical protein
MLCKPPILKIIFTLLLETLPPLLGLPISHQAPVLIIDITHLSPAYSGSLAVCFIFSLA